MILQNKQLKQNYIVLTNQIFVANMKPSIGHHVRAGIPPLYLI